jgi:catechol-2,3-dioxygenase
MASSARRKTAVTPKRSAAVSKAASARKRRAQVLVDNVTAIMLISPNAKRLCEFYRATLGLPLEEERHEGITLHYGCSVGAVHFAIHPAKGWPGVPRKNAQSPVVAFSTSKLGEVVQRLSTKGVKMIGPSDHGFGNVMSFRDPDGNAVTIIESR